MVPCTSLPQTEHFGHENFMNNLQDVKPAVNDLKSYGTHAELGKSIFSKGKTTIIKIGTLKRTCVYCKCDLKSDQLARRKMLETRNEAK